MVSNNRPQAQKGRVSFATLKKLTALMDDNRVHHLAYGDIVIDKMLPLLQDPIEQKVRTPIQQIADDLITHPKPPLTLEEEEYDIYEQFRGLSGNREGL